MLGLARLAIDLRDHKTRQSFGVRYFRVCDGGVQVAKPPALMKLPFDKGLAADANAYLCTV
jgi:hypothetical protein